MFLGFFCCVGLCYTSPTLELTATQHVLIDKIKKLKKEKEAIILCHNYQRPELYEVADFVGDSLELCIKAREAESRLILFSGVYFMAESAAILNPTRKVIVPTKHAGCALSDMITVDALKERKKLYPNAAVVCYVNSTAAVKAESDVCCTSSNAVTIVRNMPNKQILFVPDRNLANWVQKQVPEKEIIPWEGYCPIHERLTKEYLLKAKSKHPGAQIIAHPECTEEVRGVADHVVSTSGMMKIAKESPATEFITTTECGMSQRMKKEMPNKKFYSVCTVCFDMKKNTLERMVHSLETEQDEVYIAPLIVEKAARAFETMFAIMKAHEYNVNAQKISSYAGETRAVVN